MGQESSIDFDSLNLQMGEAIELFPDVKDLKTGCACQLVGTLQGEALIISNLPGAESFPNLQEGQQIAIRVKSGNGIALFATLVLFVSEVPALMIFLDLPDKVKFLQLRQASRINVALPVLVASESGGNSAGKMVDVSTGGAAILLEDSIAEPGEQIQLKGKFLVADVARVARFRAIVRRKTQDSMGRYLYGIEFSEQDDQEKLVLFGYIFQAMALGDIQAVIP